MDILECCCNVYIALYFVSSDAIKLICQRTVTSICFICVESELFIGCCRSREPRRVIDGPQRFWSEPRRTIDAPSYGFEDVMTCVHKNPFQHCENASK